LEGHERGLSKNKREWLLSKQNFSTFNQKQIVCPTFDEALQKRRELFESDLFVDTSLKTKQGQVFHSKEDFFVKKSVCPQRLTSFSEVTEGNKLVKMSKALLRMDEYSLTNFDCAYTNIITSLLIHFNS
jgi:hypothetical protein